MTKFSIEYNPYTVECTFKKNGKQLNTKSKIGAKSSERLQVLLSPSINWKGLAEEIVVVCNDDEIEIEFYGRRIDFEDLKYCIDTYMGNVKFQLSFKEGKNENDIINELDQLFSEIKEKNIPEFKQKNAEGIDIFDAYEEVKNGIFEISVLATMSSGKSTLINSMLHTELLPSENKACTATIARILNNDEMEDYEAECYGADKKTVIYPREKVTLDKLQEYNADEKVTFIELEGSIPAISSDKIRLCLRDTPGPNNSRNENHERLTRSIIKRTNAVVLYVLNITQFGTKDDNQLLKDISDEMKKAGKQSRDRFIFVINKCDELDEQKGEAIEKILVDAREYLSAFGITEPTIIPISALLALVVRKKRNGEYLTRKENQMLGQVNDYVNHSPLHFDNFATLTPTVKEKLDKQIADYHTDKENWDLEAVIHTGVPVVEETIIEYIEKYAYPMKIKDAIKDISAILDELNMKAKFEESIAQDNSKLENVREQIEIAKEKQANSQDIFENYKEKINQFSLRTIEKKEQLRKLELELEKITQPYDEKIKVDKIEADRLVEDFCVELAEIQSDCENELNRILEQEIFNQGTEMLNEYTGIVSDILGDIEIEGYNFEKLTAFEKIRIKDFEDVRKKNEQDRYRDEIRKKKNPEREGFLGFFKIWKPKEISYTVKIKEGIDVNVKNIILDMSSGFKMNTEENIDSLFLQAETEIQNYKRIFTNNLEYLSEEIGNILNELMENTKEFEQIKNRVEKNKELSEWVEDKEERLRTLMSF